MKRQNKRGRDWIGTLMAVIGIFMIGTALVLLVPVLFDYKKANDTYDTLNEEYIRVPQELDTEDAEEDAWWYRDVDIRLEELKDENEDIIGWIRFDNIELLSYPILYSGDDETYLRTDIYGNSTIAGCIFMEGMNTPDFEDCHTILYGHNMKNQSMFGSLKNFKRDGFYAGNQYFTVYTEGMAYRYQIFAYRDVSEADDIYTVGFGADDTFGEFISQMKQASYVDTGIEVTKEDKIMTLSTCSTEGNRFVVHALRVDARAYPAE